MPASFACFHTIFYLVFFLCQIAEAGAQRSGDCELRYRISYDLLQYNDSLRNADFRYALQLTQPDSQYRKGYLLRRIIAYDSLSEIGRQAVYAFAEMQRRELDAFYGVFCGKWRWLWTGSNWGTDDSPKVCNCTREIEITPDSIVYRENGQFVERVSYWLVRQPFRAGSPRFTVQIPGKPCWIITIDDKIDNWHAARVSQEKGTKFLNTQWDLGCVCGCQEDVYEQIE